MRHVHRWLPSIGPPLDRFPKGRLDDPLGSISRWAGIGNSKVTTHQTMQLVISLQQIHPLTAVARQSHTLRPLPFECPVLINGHKPMRWQDRAPKSVAFIVILGGVFGVPPETIPRRIKCDVVLLGVVEWNRLRRGSVFRREV